MNISTWKRMKGLVPASSKRYNSIYRGNSHGWRENDFAQWNVLCVQAVVSGPPLIPLSVPTLSPLGHLEGFIEHMGKMASRLNSTVLSKYIHGCGLILLHRKELSPGKQAGKREEPGGGHQKWARPAQAGAHGCCASSRGSGRCHSGKSHGEISLCTQPLETLLPVKPTCLASNVFFTGTVEVWSIPQTAHHRYNSHDNLPFGALCFSGCAGRR